MHLAKLLNGLATDEARQRAHAYGSITHEELLGVGFTPDEATAIIDRVLVDVFRRLALGVPAESRKCRQAERAALAAKHEFSPLCTNHPLLQRHRCPTCQTLESRYLQYRIQRGLRPHQPA